MAYDEELAQRIRSALAGSEGITEMRRFGGIAFLRNELMLVGVSDTSLMARVGKENYEDSLSRKNVRPMDFTGRPMRGYVFVVTVTQVHDLHSSLRPAKNNCAFDNFGIKLRNVLHDWLEPILASAGACLMPVLLQSVIRIVRAKH